LPGLNELNIEEKMTTGRPGLFICELKQVIAKNTFLKHKHLLTYKVEDLLCTDRQTDLK
jgi:hypothetical protein